jgi:hypothetical protein
MRISGPATDLGMLGGHTGFTEGSGVEGPRTAEGRHLLAVLALVVEKHGDNAAFTKHFLHNSTHSVALQQTVLPCRARAWLKRDLGGHHWHSQPRLVVSCSGVGVRGAAAAGIRIGSADGWMAEESKLALQLLSNVRHRRPRDLGACRRSAQAQRGADGVPTDTGHRAQLDRIELLVACGRVSTVRERSALRRRDSAGHHLLNSAPRQGRGCMWRRSTLNAAANLASSPQQSLVSQ